MLFVVFLCVFFWVKSYAEVKGSGTNELSRVDNPTTTNGPYFQFDLSKKTTGLNAR